MIHVSALPGTPKNQLSIAEITKKVIHEASIYLEAGIDSIMIENMHDVPYLKGNVGPEIIASMTAVASELRKLSKKPLGIQILAAANKEALAVAQAAEFNFIRAEGFVYGHLADEGYIDSCAGELLRYRKSIGADNIAIYTDVKKKHSSHTISSDISLAETVKTADYFLSDGIVVTGISTGEEVLIDDVKTAMKASTLPVIIGSGINANNIAKYWPYANAFIVGSSFKETSNWKNPVSKEFVTNFINRVQIERSKTNQ